MKVYSDEIIKHEVTCILYTYKIPEEFNQVLTTMVFNGVQEFIDIINLNFVSQRENISKDTLMFRIRMLNDMLSEFNRLILDAKKAKGLNKNDIITYKYTSSYIENWTKSSYSDLGKIQLLTIDDIPIFNNESYLHFHIDYTCLILNICLDFLNMILKECYTLHNSSRMLLKSKYNRYEYFEVESKSILKNLGALEKNIIEDEFSPIFNSLTKVLEIELRYFVGKNLKIGLGKILKKIQQDDKIYFMHGIVDKILEIKLKISNIH